MNRIMTCTYPSYLYLNKDESKSLIFHLAVWRTEDPLLENARELICKTRIPWQSSISAPDIAIQNDGQPCESIKLFTCANAEHSSKLKEIQNNVAIKRTSRQDPEKVMHIFAAIFTPNGICDTSTLVPSIEEETSERLSEKAVQYVFSSHRDDKLLCSIEYRPQSGMMSISPVCSMHLSRTITSNELDELNMFNNAVLLSFASAGGYTYEYCIQIETSQPVAKKQMFINRDPNQLEHKRRRLQKYRARRHWIRPTIPHKATVSVFLELVSATVSSGFGLQPGDFLSLEYEMIFPKDEIHFSDEDHENSLTIPLKGRSPFTLPTYHVSDIVRWELKQTVHQALTSCSMIASLCFSGTIFQLWMNRTIFNCITLILIIIGCVNGGLYHAAMGTPTPPRYLFNWTINFNLMRSSDQKCELQSSDNCFTRPVHEQDTIILLIKAVSQRSFERTILGHGALYLPLETVRRESKSHETTVVLWRPVGDLENMNNLSEMDLKRVFLGGSCIISSHDIVTRQSRYGLVSEPSGIQVQVRLKACSFFDLSDSH